MTVCHGISEYQATEYGAHVALGYFDGMHLGHQAVVRTCAGGSGSCDSVVLTFAQSPAVALGKARPAMLSGLAEKASMMEAAGIRTVIFADFAGVQDMSAARFVSEVLHTALRAKKVYCGYNYHFGKNGSGDTHLLRELCGQHGIQVEVIPPVYLDGTAVSSTEIRRRLSDGDIAGANRMLGYRYRVVGRIDSGNHIGTAMGYPTVNIPIREGMIVPAYGVYATDILIDGLRYRGATNIGVHPTVKQNTAPLCETYLLDYHGGDLYGSYAVCELIRFIRPERKFVSLQELRDQVQRDIETIRKI